MTDRPEVQLDDLYREVVMDHYRDPRGRLPLEHADARAHGLNPVCGDEVRLALAFDGETVAGVEVQGHGCAICTASGSIMAEQLPGRTAEQAAARAEAFRAVMHGTNAPHGMDLGELVALEGVQRFPIRVKCAMLPWVTLLDAIRAWRAGDSAPTTSTEAP